MTYGPQPGWNPNQPPGYPPAPPPGYPAPPGQAPMGPPAGQYPIGPGQPGNQPQASPATAIVAGVLALLAVVLTAVFRAIRHGFRFAFDWPYTLDLPGHIIVIAVLGAGGVMLLLRKRPGQIIAIVGAVLDIAVTLFFDPGFPRFGVWIIDIATIVVCALPSTARALTGGPAAPPPFMPMGPPGQFGPPPGQPMPGQVMPGQPVPGQPMAGPPMPQQQFPPQPGFPGQQPPMPPPGYPQQQFL